MLHIERYVRIQVVLGFTQDISKLDERFKGYHCKLGIALLLELLIYKLQKLTH